MVAAALSYDETLWVPLPLAYRREVVIKGVASTTLGGKLAVIMWQI